MDQYTTIKRIEKWVFAVFLPMQSPLHKHWESLESESIESLQSCYRSTFDTVSKSFSCWFPNSSIKKMTNIKKCGCNQQAALPQRKPHAFSNRGIQRLKCSITGYHRLVCMRSGRYLSPAVRCSAGQPSATTENGTYSSGIDNVPRIRSMVAASA